MHTVEATRATLQEHIVQENERRTVDSHGRLRQIRRTARESDQQGQPESDRLEDPAGIVKESDGTLIPGDWNVSRWEQIQEIAGSSCEKRMTHRRRLSNQVRTRRRTP